MANNLEWQLRLIDKVSDPAAVISKVLDAVSKQFDHLSEADKKSADVQKRMSAVRRDAMRELERHAKAAEKASIKSAVESALPHEKHQNELLELALEKSGAIAGAIQGGMVGAIGLAEKGLEKVWEAWKGIGEVVFDLAREAWGTMVKAEQSSLRMTTLLGPQAREVAEYVDHIARNSYFSEDALKGAAKQLALAGVKAEGMPAALSMAADLAALLGEDVRDVAQTLGRATLTGRIDPKIFKALMLNVPEGEKFLEQALGTNKAGVKRAMEEGRIGADKIMAVLGNLISKKTGKALGGFDEAMGRTTGSLWEKLKAAPGRFFEELSKQGAKSGAYSKVNEILGKLVDAFDPGSPTGQRVMAALEDMVAKISHALGFDDKDFGAGIVRIFENLPAVIDKTIAAITAIGSAIQFAINVGRAFVGVMQEASRPVAWLMDLNDKIMSGVTGGARNRETGARQGRAIGEGIELGTNEALEVHSPSRVFERIGEQAAAGFAEGVGGAREAFPVPSAGGVARAGGAVVTVPVEITVNGAGQDGQALGQAIARELTMTLPGALQCAFESVAIEAGA